MTSWAIDQIDRADPMGEAPFNWLCSRCAECGEKRCRGYCLACGLRSHSSGSSPASSLGNLHSRRPQCSEKPARSCQTGYRANVAPDRRRSPPEVSSEGELRSLREEPMTRKIDAYDRFSDRCRAKPDVLLSVGCPVDWNCYRPSHAPDILQRAGRQCPLAGSRPMSGSGAH